MKGGPFITQGLFISFGGGERKQERQRAVSLAKCCLCWASLPVLDADSSQAVKALTGCTSQTGIHWEWDLSLGLGNLAALKRRTASDNIPRACLYQSEQA